MEECSDSHRDLETVGPGKIQITLMYREKGNQDNLTSNSVLDWLPLCSRAEQTQGGGLACCSTRSKELWTGRVWSRIGKLACFALFFRGAVSSVVHPIMVKD